MSKAAHDYKRINRQFLNYVIPSVIAMVISSVYIILDGIFVGRGIGDVALGAVNIAFPYMFFIMAITLLIAIGGANVYSFLKGEGEPEKANNVFCQCLALLVIVGTLTGLFGIVLSDQLARFLGANEDLLPYASVFLRWIAPFVLLQTVGMGVGVFVRNDGAPKLVMVSTVLCSVVNVLLEYVFIIVLHKGIEFTAIANGIAMTVQIGIYIVYFVRKRGTLRIRKPVFLMGDLKRVLANGTSTFLMEFSQSTVAFSFNLAFIHTVGTIGVSAYAIVTYVGAIIYTVLIGVVQGVQPIMSFNHGNGDEKIVRHVYTIGIKTNIAASVVYIVACFAFGGGMVSLFHTGNPALTDLTTQILRILSFGNLAIGITLMNILYFQTTERNVYSTIASFLRCVGFVQVFLLIFVPLFNTAGIYMALLAGEVCNCVVSLILVRKAMKTLGLKMWHTNMTATAEMNDLKSE